MVNELTPAQIERLALLTEELGEALQAVGKILRHGFRSVDPTGTITGKTTNRQALEQELGDVLAAIRLMHLAADLNEASLDVHRVRKLKKVQNWLHETENRELAELGELSSRGQAKPQV